MPVRAAKNDNNPPPPASSLPRPKGAGKRSKSFAALRPRRNTTNAPPRCQLAFFGFLSGHAGRNRNDPRQYNGDTLLRKPVSFQPHPAGISGSRCKPPTGSPGAKLAPGPASRTAIPASFPPATMDGKVAAARSREGLSLFSGVAQPLHLFSRALSTPTHAFSRIPAGSFPNRRHRRPATPLPYAPARCGRTVSSEHRLCPSTTYAGVMEPSRSFFTTRLAIPAFRAHRGPASHLRTEIRPHK